MKCFDGFMPRVMGLIKSSGFVLWLLWSLENYSWKLLQEKQESATKFCYYSFAEE